ncbi:PH domain-containing protein [Nostocoides sp. HKS02]|uniref:PH domain-containing protein n=1 Tax=Nostocoides sp. HKS02 TaxID=1813880 RepID=UPI001E3C9EE2|nr:PH domain-containing protein [Tetrasphaera sp. HKS02]
MAIAAAVLSVVIFGVVAVFLPGPAQAGNWRVGDRVFFAGLGVAMAYLLWRYASIRATPTRETLTVRNLFTTRAVSWQSVVDVKFAGGDPWVSLELDDTDVLAVMAIQKADSTFALAEARRLVALVQALGPSAASPDVTLD